MNILELTADEVKRFFLEHENYFSLKLPDYINFQELLDKLSVEMGEGNYTSILEKIVYQIIMMILIIHFIITKMGIMIGDHFK